MAQQSHDVTTRELRVSSAHGRGLFAEVKLHHFDDDDDQYGKTPKGTEKVGQYAFVRLDRDNVADEVRGDVPDADGPVLTYIGSSFGKWFYRSRDREGIPVDVYEELVDHGATLLDDVDGGWSNWDGRPEWSETYVDVSEAETVDMAEVIEERRDEDTEVDA